MKTIVINPKENKIECKELNSLKEYYAEIGNSCSLVEAVTVLPNGDTLMIDEEGLFHEHEEGFVFGVGDDTDVFSQYFIIVGKGIICGGNNDGETIDSQSSIQQIASRVLWLTNENVQKYKNEFA